MFIRFVSAGVLFEGAFSLWLSLMSVLFVKGNFATVDKHQNIVNVLMILYIE